MDNEKTYVEKVNDWLNADPKTRSIQEGATLMLQGNRNQILYKNMIHKSNFEKVIYELEKIIDGKRVIVAPVSEEVKELENDLPKTMEIIEDKLAGESKGKRPDHDTLPTAVQIAFDKNREIYPRMRSIQEHLKVLNSVGTAAQRLPLLTELLALDEALRTNWNVYDKFDVNAPLAAAAVNIPAGEKIDAKRVSANRKYLSDNKSKLLTLVNDGKTDKVIELRAKMQIRLNELIQNGETFAPEQLTELNALGVIVEAPVITEGENTEDKIVDPVVDTTEITEGENTEETPEENVIGQIKALLKNNIEQKEIIKTIYSLGNFEGLELTPDVVIELLNQAIDQEINSVE